MKSIPRVVFLVFLLAAPGNPAWASSLDSATIYRMPAGKATVRLDEGGQAQQMLQEVPSSVHIRLARGMESPGTAFHACRDSVGAFYDARVSSSGMMGCQHEDNGWNRTSRIAGGAISLPIGR